MFYVSSPQPSPWANLPAQRMLTNYQLCPEIHGMFIHCSIVFIVLLPHYINLRKNPTHSGCFYKLFVSATFFRKGLFLLVTGVFWHTKQTTCLPHGTQDTETQKMHGHFHILVFFRSFIRKGRSYCNNVNVFELCSVLFQTRVCRWHCF